MLNQLAKNISGFGKKKLIAIIIVIAVSISLIGVACSSEGYDDPLSVLKVCCNALNNNDKRALDKVVYDKLGDDFNNYYVYDVIDQYLEQQMRYGEPYSELTTDIASYDHYEPESVGDDLDDIEESIFREFGVIVDIDEAYIYSMNHESEMEIGVIRVENRWYLVGIFVELL